MTTLVRTACLAAGLLLIAAPAGAALPDEITVKSAAKLELMRGDKVSGSVSLVAGEKLALIDTAGDYAFVRFRNLNGRVLIDHTDLSVAATGTMEVVPALAAAVPPVSVTPPASAKTAPASVAPHQLGNTLERALAGKLVRFEHGALRPFDVARLAGVKFYALYYTKGPSLLDFTRGC